MIQPFARGHVCGQTLEAHPIWSPIAAPGPRTARRLCETAAFAAAAAFAVPVGEIHAVSRRSSYVALARFDRVQLLPLPRPAHRVVVAERAGDAPRQRAAVVLFSRSCICLNLRGGRDGR